MADPISPTPDTTSDKACPSPIQGAPPPAEVQAYFDKTKIEPLSGRTIGGWIAGAIGAVAGWYGGETYTRAKIWHFDGAVDNLVRKDIMNRGSGVGAGLDSAGAIDPMPHLGGLGPGAGSHSLRLAHEYNLAESGKYPFARFIKKFGTLPMLVGSAIVGGAIALAAYFSIAPKKKDQAADPSFSTKLVSADAVPAGAPAPEKPKEWKASVSKAAEPQPETQRV